MEVRVERLQNRFYCKEDSAPNRLAFVPLLAHALLWDKLLNISAQDKSGRFPKEEADFRKVSGGKRFRRRISGGYCASSWRIVLSPEA